MRHLSYMLLLTAVTTAAGADGVPNILDYDCQARITRVETLPAPTGDSWICPTGTIEGMTNDTFWVRNSLEYCRLTVSVYANAARTARDIVRKRHLGRHGWVVLMDADETVLDNSLFEREITRCAGRSYSEDYWNQWVVARETPASPQGMARDVPGAAAFTRAIRAMGGLVAIVTNRLASLDEVTRDNLTRAGIVYDYEIGWDGVAAHKDKVERWHEAVAALGRQFRTKPVPILWVGDQVTDFAMLDKRGRMVRAVNQSDQDVESSRSHVLLPNPMYGAWQRNTKH